MCSSSAYGYGGVGCSLCYLHIGPGGEGHEAYDCEHHLAHALAQIL